MRAHPALVLLTVLGIAAPPAGAATLVVEPPPPCSGVQSKYGLCEPPTLRLRDAAGEVNHIGVASSDTEYAFTDAVSPLTAGAGCTQRSERTVACPRGLRMLAELGEGADVMDAGPIAMGIYGEGGDDRLKGANLVGGAGDDELASEPGVEFAFLSGGPGADSLTGNERSNRMLGDEGPDRLSGGAGGDVLLGGAGDDMIDGGADVDQVSYEERRHDVIVDLRAGVGGGPGERDTLVNVENGRGGQGDDLLIGDDGPNGFLGRGGDDLLVGAGGDDVLYGEPGRDHLVGGDGDDSLDAASTIESLADRFERAGTPNRVDCGPGRDQVAPGAGGDRLARDCETIAGWSTGDETRAVRLLDAQPVRVSRRRLTMRLACPRRRGRCRGTLTVSGPAMRPATRRFRLPGRGGTVTVRTRAGDLRSARGLRIGVRFAGEGPRTAYLLDGSAPG